MRSGEVRIGIPRNVYASFDNTDKLLAPRDAQALMRRLEET